MVKTWRRTHEAPSASGAFGVSETRVPGMAPKAQMTQTSGTCPPLSGNTILRKPKKGKR